MNVKFIVFDYFLQYQAYFLIEDDIMDHSKMRRGQPCWYLHNDIGLAGINDGILVEQATFQLLRTHFRGKPCYLDLLETFHDVIIDFLYSEIQIVII